MQLPSVGDVQGQAQAGQNLANQIEQAAGPGGDPSALLEEGIALAGTAIGGSDGVAIGLETIGGALAGFAMAGPMGAAIAFVGSFASVLEGYVHSADTAVANGVSKATLTISSRIAGFGKPVGAGPNIGAPGGWSAADWSAFARPPSTTRNASKAAEINDNGRQYMWNASAGKSLKPLRPATGSQLLQWIRSQKPLCTPIWFYWSDPGKVVDCDSDLYFGSGGAGGSVSVLKQRWVQGTTAFAGMTQEQIVNAAIPRLPDPLYWAADLYGIVGPGNMFGSGYSTAWFNIDLINAMATVLTMLSMGASIQAIVSELLIQSYILSVQGDQDSTGRLHQDGPSCGRRRSRARPYLRSEVRWGLGWRRGCDHHCASPLFARHQDVARDGGPGSRFSGGEALSMSLGKSLVLRPVKSGSKMSSSSPTSSTAMAVYSPTTPSVAPYVVGGAVGALALGGLIWYLTR